MIKVISNFARPSMIYLCWNDAVKMLKSVNIVLDVSVSNMISSFVLLRLTVLNAHILAANFRIYWHCSHRHNLEYFDLKSHLVWDTVRAPYYAGCLLKLQVWLRISGHLCTTGVKKCKTKWQKWKETGFSYFDSFSTLDPVINQI